MSIRILSVPGYKGSGEQHWQTWLEPQLNNCQRIDTIDWNRPILHNWVKEIVRAIDSRPEKVLLIAHSFGCLATAMAAEQRPGMVTGIILVAPADPQRFGLFGHKETEGGQSIASFLPETLAIPGVLVASRNDPWMLFRHAWAWSKRWNLTFIDAGEAGHINAESGYGPWPLIRLITDSVIDSIKHRQQGQPARLSYPLFSQQAVRMSYL